MAERRRQPYLKSFILTLVGLLVLLGLVEGLGRLVYYVKEGVPFETTHRLAYNFFGYAQEVDGPLRYRPRPNYRAPEVSINSLGFRGPEFTLSKEPGTFRIVVLGDSTTFGLGASNNDATYPLLLQELLNKDGGLPRFEVINAGVPGYNSFQAAAILEQGLLASQPDLVLVYIGTNDARYPMLMGDKWYPGATEMDFMSKRGWMMDRIRNFLHENSVSYTLVRGILPRLLPVYRMARGEATPVHDPSFDDHPVYKYYEQNLLRIADLSRSVGARVWLLTWPWRDVSAEPPVMQMGKQKAFASMQRVSQMEGVSIMDLEAGFDREEHKDRLFLDDVHFSDEGHRLDAELIYRALQSSGIAR